MFSFFPSHNRGLTPCIVEESHIFIVKTVYIIKTYPKGYLLGTTENKINDIFHSGRLENSNRVCKL